MKHFNKKLITSIITTLAIASFSLGSFASTMPNGMNVITLPTIIVRADSSKTKDIHLTLNEVNKDSQEKTVLNEKSVLMNQAPYSILISKNNIQKDVDNNHKVLTGETLVTLILDKANNVTVKVSMKSENIEQTFFSNLIGDHTSINIFPTTGNNKALVLNLDKNSDATKS